MPASMLSPAPTVLFTRTGRRFRYDGHPQAEHVVVAIGSGAEMLRATAAYLNDSGERVGVLQTLLYQPRSAQHFWRRYRRAPTGSPSSIARRNPVQQ